MQAFYKKTETTHKIKSLTNDFAIIEIEPFKTLFDVEIDFKVVPRKDITFVL